MKIGRDEFSQYLKYNEAILKDLPINLIVTDRDQRLKFINDSARDFFALQDSAFFDLPMAAILQGENERFVTMLKSVSAEQAGSRLLQRASLPLPPQERHQRRRLSDL